MTHTTILLIACLIPFALYGVCKAVDWWKMNRDGEIKEAERE